ncbi:MAG TPA: tetratricopeptide repeat protein [Thermoanaerobaculia bacterium]|nr:tetratricopeptide repeat protein [Thermoanaerobaculia bacterium]
MDRQHRRELKHDKFVDEVGVLTTRARANQRLLLTIGVALLAVALAAYGYYFYQSNRERQAQAILATAIETFESPLVQPDAPQADPRAKFRTEAERTAAAEKQFRDVQARFGGTNSADVAGLYIARISAGRGDVATARAMLQNFVDNQPRHFLVGAARYSLYQMRIDNGEALQVITELNAELARSEPILPADSLLVLVAHAHEVQGDDAKSRETYRRIVTEYPDSPFALEAQRRVGPA